MDRRTGLGLLLFVTLFYTWALLRKEPEPVEGADGATQADGTAADGGRTTAPAPVASAAPTVAEAAEVAFAGCGAEGTYSTREGYGDVVLPEHEGPLKVQPLYSWLLSAASGEMTTWKPWGDPPGPEQLLSEYASALTVGAGAWSQGPATLAVVDHRAGLLVLEGLQGDIRIRHQIAVDEDVSSGTCVFDVDTTWTNAGSGTNTLPLWVGAHERIEPAGGGGMMARYDSHTQPLLHVDGDLAYGDEDGGKVGGCMGMGAVDPEAPGEPVAVDGPVDWFGIADRYFGFLVLSETDGAVGHFSTRTPVGTDVPLAGTHVSFTPTLAPGQAHQASFRVYAGPLDAKALDAVDPSLGDAIDLGFFAFFGYPLLWLLRVYQGIVGNWGVAIILLTLTVKAAFFRMTQSSYVSMQRMQQIQPEMNRIREEYADEPQEMNRLTMELMAREQVNPLSGCLPMFAQMPVWFALYQVLLTSVDLYHTDFLYLRDLSAPDPYCVLPVMVVILMVIQQSFTNTANMDPAQARVMKFMPLMFGLFFFTFPSGLALYMFVNMLLSILQQWWIKRSLGDAPAKAAV
jgi:YidC/Oxa1 family membrane protein insertase